MGLFTSIPMKVVASGAALHIHNVIVEIPYLSVIYLSAKFHLLHFSR